MNQVKNCEIALFLIDHIDGRESPLKYNCLFWNEWIIDILHYLSINSALD